MDTKKTVLIGVVLVISMIMAALQMCYGETVPGEFWAVIYSILGFLGIAVAAPAAKAGIKSIAKKLSEPDK